MTPRINLIYYVSKTVRRDLIHDYSAMTLCYFDPQEHENRRKFLAMQAYKSKRERDSAHESHYSAKFQKRYVDQQRREHEDQLRYFQVS